MSPNGVPSRISIFLIISFVIQISCFVGPAPSMAQREHLIYFPNTAYELNVYKICGKQPGKTLMLIGGIQGNEPGGFLSADLYADMSLEKGNLIVVPRANFYSILLNKRGPHGDMNRKFTHEDTAESMEDKIVAILKKLIAQSDYLLNLHDGSGYYYPEYIDKWRNPMRFGQSIISDCELYNVPGTNQTLDLATMAGKVIKEVNSHIKNRLYQFHYNNTKTGEPDSAHKEQRKSATYYALTKHHIPAFGVETSKFLPSMDLKVRYHNLIINTFMKHFDIIPEHPGIALAPPVLKYLVLSTNGKSATVINDKQTIYLLLGDTLHVSHIEANYERGLSLDILGHGDLNDYRKNISIIKNTRMIVRKDNQTFAEIPIVVTGNRALGDTESKPPLKVEYLVVEAKGNRFLLEDGETLRLVKGDHMKIVDVLPPSLESSGLTVNFKGFVGNSKNNTGEDRGYDINTATDLMKRYSLRKKGEKYRIEASDGHRLLATFYVTLRPASFEYLILRINDHSCMVLKPDDTAPLSVTDEIVLDDIRTDLYGESGFYLSIEGHELRKREKQSVGTFLKAGGKRKCEALVKKDEIRLGKIHFRLKKRP